MVQEDPDKQSVEFLVKQFGVKEPLQEKNIERLESEVRVVIPFS